ncbi:MAG: NUDIX hydrolase [Gordonia sp. (in: high G+C Gram-positive bacteria)]
MMSSTRSRPGTHGKVIWAAGGVLWRGHGRTLEVGLVHRPHYDDWTLPKGKLDKDETLLDTAVRELAEETGHHVRLGRHLATVAYDLPAGRKRVRYWSAESLGGTFAAGREVDALAWLSVDAAAARLSYRLDRRVLREFTRLPADLDTLLLVRHAKAGRRSRYRGDDRRRPLDKDGRRQARALVGVLQAFGVTDLHSADRTRCVQTFLPMQEALGGVDIVDEPTLTEEAYGANPGAGRKRLRELTDVSARKPGDRHAVCSQGKVIPPLLAWWADHDGISLPPARNRKASVWVLSTRRGRLVAADHLDPV